MWDFSVRCNWPFIWVYCYRYPLPQRIDVMYLLLSDVIDLLYEYTATGTPSPKELTLCTCYCLSQLSNLFFLEEGRGTGKGWGFDWHSLPSGGSFDIYLHVHACLRVEMFDCGLESCKQTNHMLAIAHFRVALSPFLKPRPSAKPFIWI